MKKFSFVKNFIIQEYRLLDLTPFCLSRHILKTGSETLLIEMKNALPNLLGQFG
jgi:hypothetical protein